MKKIYLLSANIIMIICLSCNSEKAKTTNKGADVKMGTKSEIEKEKKARETRRKAFNKLSESLDSTKKK